MYLVLAANDLAKDIINLSNKAVDNKLWLSECNYSRFLHYIHKVDNDLVAQSKLSKKTVIYKSKNEKHEEYVAKVIADAAAARAACASKLCAT